MINSKKQTSNKKYLRDGRAPVPKYEKISRVMSANKGKDTTPEMLLRRLLSSNGIRGYRQNWKKAPGRPDVAFPKRKIAIFIDGCFWHGCKKCYVAPKTNSRFWKQKIERNQKRDIRNSQELKKLGWTCVRIWEHELKKNPEKVTAKLFKKLGK